MGKLGFDAFLDAVDHDDARRMGEISLQSTDGRYQDLKEQYEQMSDEDAAAAMQLLKEHNGDFREAFEGIFQTKW